MGWLAFIVLSSSLRMAIPKRHSVCCSRCSVLGRIGILAYHVRHMDDLRGLLRGRQWDELPPSSSPFALGGLRKLGFNPTLHQVGDFKEEKLLIEIPSFWRSFLFPHRCACDLSPSYNGAGLRDLMCSRVSKDLFCLSASSLTNTCAISPSVRARRCLI
jgi:hypothetical protein